MPTTAMVQLYFVKMRIHNGDPQYYFMFNPTQVVTLTPGPAGTEYTITIHLTSNVPGAVISAFDLLSGSANPDVTGQGSTTLTVTFTNDQATTVNYAITVQVGDQTFTSPDPEIEIPPPNG